MPELATHEVEVASRFDKFRPQLNALLLDDSQFDRRRVRRLSRETGLPIFLDEAPTIASFAQALEEGAFDVILLDYNLPEGDGIEALRLVKSCERNKDCPTIMIAGDAQTSVAVQALRQGCTDYIGKSELTANTLKASILSVIEEAASEAEKGTLFDQKIDGIATSIMMNYTKCLQPDIARILRDLRELKRLHAQPDVNVPGSLEAIEHKCLKLLSVLRDPGYLDKPNKLN